MTAKTSKNKRIIAAMVAVALVLPSLPMAELGALTQVYAEERGTPDATQYETIDSAQEFANFTQAVNAGEISPTGTVTITTDLDMTGIDFEPINFLNFNLDFAGYTVSNLNVTTSGYESYAGLIAHRMGNHTQISDICISDCVLNTFDVLNVGIVTGIADRAEVYNSKIENVTVNAHNAYLVGGVIGDKQWDSFTSYDMYAELNNVTINATGTYLVGVMVGRLGGDAKLHVTGVIAKNIAVNAEFVDSASVSWLGGADIPEYATVADGAVIEIEIVTKTDENDGVFSATKYESIRYEDIIGEDYYGAHCGYEGNKKFDDSIDALIDASSDNGTELVTAVEPGWSDYYIYKWNGVMTAKEAGTYTLIGRKIDNGFMMKVNGEKVYEYWGASHWFDGSYDRLVSNLAGFTLDKGETATVEIYYLELGGGDALEIYATTTPENVNSGANINDAFDFALEKTTYSLVNFDSILPWGVGTDGNNGAQCVEENYWFDQTIDALMSIVQETESRTVGSFNEGKFEGDNYIVKYEGSFTPQTTGTYTFGANKIDNGFVLFIDGVKVYEMWANGIWNDNGSGNVYPTSITLEEGNTYDFEAYYLELGGGEALEITASVNGGEMIAIEDVFGLPGDNDAIAVGEVKTVTIAEPYEIKYLTFVPEQDGTYCFYSISNSDTVGEIFDADFNSLAWNDDGVDWNFSVTADLVAGETYYLAVQYYDWALTGSFAVRVKDITVESIELVSDSITLFENFSGYWDTRYDAETDSYVEFFHYYGWGGSETPVIRINYKDGTSKTSEIGEYVDGYWIDTWDNQYDDPWTLGGDNYLTITWADFEIQLHVEIIANPLDSMNSIEVTDSYAAGIELWDDGATDYLFDGDAWYSKMGGYVNDTFFSLYFSTEASTVHTYAVYTGFDSDIWQGRNPQGWVFYGSNDGVNWTVIDTVEESGLQDAGSKLYTYTVDNPGEYTQYKIVFELNPNGLFEFQLGELILLNDPDYVSPRLPGDADGNGQVNMRDAVMIQQSLNSWDVEIDEIAADVNADGQVNMRDAVLIQQYLNGWDVELK